MPEINADENAVLRQLALAEGVDPATLFISGDVVFQLEGESVTGTICQVGTPHWIEAARACES